jgi:hypothetical protein
MIINVDLAERKIGLSLRAAEGVAAGGTPEEQMARRKDSQPAASNEASREDIDRYIKRD